MLLVFWSTPRLICLLSFGCLCLCHVIIGRMDCIDLYFPGSYVKCTPMKQGIIRNLSTDNEAQSPSVSADLCHKPTTFSPGRLVKQDFSGSLLKNLILPSSQNKEVKSAIQTSPVQVSFIFFWKTAGPITSVARLASISVEPLLFVARSKSQDCTMLYMRFVPILPIQTS